MLLLSQQKNIAIILLLFKRTFIAITFSSVYKPKAVKVKYGSRGTTSDANFMADLLEPLVLTKSGPVNDNRQCLSLL